MQILTEDAIRLGASAVDKMDAIQQSGELLVRAGFVEAAYVDGMLAREEILSNYIGNGIAIPHGRREDLKKVLRTGISVLQLPQGVAWEPGQIVYLVIGLAVANNERISIFTDLLEVLKDKKTIHLLTHTTDSSVILERLTRSLAE